LIAERSSLANEASHDRWIKWLVVPIYIGCLFAFLTDIFQEIYVAFGLFYLPLICTGVFYENRAVVWRLAAAASMMVMIGFFLPNINPDWMPSLVNRVLSIIAITLTATLISYARMVQDRLAAQTARAEAGERLKSEVFTTLSQEIRAPMHSMIALCNVLIPDCRPDQRVPLQQFTAGTRRLLGTIDNLIDLTRLDRQTINIEPVAVMPILRESMEVVRGAAAEKQILVALDNDSDCQKLASGDRWAIRRIVDNVLANALRFSPPGSVVELAAEATPRSVRVIVRDTGIGMSDVVLRYLASPATPQENPSEAMDATGSGLALCRRLAIAMNAELSFDSEIGSGTTVTLQLPLAEPAN